MSLRILASLPLFVLALPACREKPPEAAPPAARLGPAPPPPPTPSRFDVPLEYDFTPVLAVVERVVPRTFGSLEERRRVGDDERRQYAFEARRGDFTAFARDSLVHLRARLSYAARGYYKPPVGPTLSAGCGGGTERPEIVVELVTPLTLDSTWHLRSRARIARLAPESSGDEDRCRVSVIRYDVTDRVVDAARRALLSRLPQIDRTVARIDLTDRATGWWAALERPIRLADGVWLQLRPQRLRVGRVTGEGRVLTVQAGLDALPLVTVGPAPPRDSTPLPPLGHDTTAGGFRIVLDGHVDYATASRELTDALRGRTVSRMGRSIALHSVVASPDTTGRLALLVGFTGDADGRLRLVGTPRHDERRGEIGVPDLEYDLATDDGLVTALAWVRSEQLRELLRERARIPVAPVLARGRELLTKGLNRTIARKLVLSATVDSVTVEGLYVTPEGILVRAGATGHAQVAVRQ